MSAARWGGHHLTSESDRANDRRIPVELSAAEADQQVRAAEREWLDHWVRGPQRLRWAEPPVASGDKAPDIQLQDASGATTSISAFWHEQPALLIFWRHYGCGCGLDRAVRLQQEYAAYTGAGAQVVIVGQGEPERARAYAQRYELPDCPILCDPELEAYQRYGLLEGDVPQLLFDAPEEYWSHSREIGEQFIADRREIDRPLVDNPWQLPGEFVIDTTGTIRLAYRYQYCEDFPDPRVLVTAIKRSLQG